MPHSGMCLHTCVCLSACPSLCSVCWQGLPPIQCDCSSKPCSQATLSPGNTSKVHRGETSARHKGRENIRKKERAGRAGSTSCFPPFGFHLHGYTALHNICLHSLKIWQLHSKSTVWQYTEDSLQLYSETHMNSKPGR